MQSYFSRVQSDWFCTEIDSIIQETRFISTNKRGEQETASRVEQVETGLRVKAEGEAARLKGKVYKTVVRPAMIHGLDMCRGGRRYTG